MNITHEQIMDGYHPKLTYNPSARWNDTQRPTRPTFERTIGDRNVSPILVCYHRDVPYCWLSWYEEGIDDRVEYGYGEEEYNGEWYEPEKWTLLSNYQETYFPTQRPTEKVETLDLLHTKGGAWLGQTREWIMRTAYNGECVEWGSNDRLKMDLTVRDIEEFAAMVAAAAINEDRRR